MKILIVGKGGREHAIAWKVSKSKKVSKVFVAPGNAGMTNVAELIDISDTNIKGLVQFAKKENIDLTIVGPESSLSSGIVNEFERNGLTIFGPTKEAAEIESSKSYCKYILEKYKIPTANYTNVSSKNEAMQIIRKKDFPIVLKVDGLAAGKGVMIPTTLKDAEKYLTQIFVEKKFGIQKNILIEDFLEGIEFSFLALVNNELVIPLQIAQDHKRAFDNDKGENTGGMGAYTPVNHLSKKIESEGINILNSMALALKKEGRPFKGILFAGLMATKKGVKVIEFNARFGDPETEVILPAMENDLVDVIENLLQGKNTQLKWSEKKFVGIVLASQGYPDSHVNGKDLNWKAISNNELCFAMGIKKEKSKYISNGGRVIIAVGEDKDFTKAKNKAYKQIKKVSSTNFFYRNDIGNSWKK